MKLVDEWRGWWKQSSTQLALLSIVSMALSWFAENYQSLSDYVSPGTFQIISFVAAALVPVARQVVQQSVTEAKNDGKSKAGV